MLDIDTLQRFPITHTAESKGIDHGFEFRDYAEYGSNVSGQPILSIALGC